MPDCRQSSVLRLLCLAVLLLAACTPPPPAVDNAELTAAEEARLAGAEATVAQRATDQAITVATDVAATLTAQPTNTPTSTYTPTPEPTATDTPRPTKTPTPQATATETKPPSPTAPPVSPTPTAPPAPASVYSTVGGPANFLTAIICERAGVECTPVMPPGDISFEFLLGSDALAPWAVFLPYGLSVERDGANVADMFMFVDAGYLPPDSLAWFGASRNFTVPGRYVIRSSGCMAISAAPCNWTTMAGTVVTFVIK